MKVMKTILCICLMVLVLPAAACAQTQEEWNLSCNYKTSCSTTVTRIVGDAEEYETIPANTYVRITDSVGSDRKVIKYMINGVTRSGMVSSSCLVRCSSQYRQPDGQAENIHELDPNHDSILENNDVILVAPSILQEGTGDYSDLTYEIPDSSAAQDAQSTSERAPSTVSSSQGKATDTSDEPEVTTTSNGNVQVPLELLGSTTSKVTYNGATTEVATADLVFSTDVPEDKRIAVVYAPNTGKASLRAKASSSADVLKKCKAGTIVSVLEYGKKFCKINYNGSVGYILTSCLQFISPDEQSVGTGVLTYKGKATGRTTINVRNDADGDSAKITEWKTGTSVQVYGEKDGWYEIEANGMRGYVMEKFLTMENE